MGILPSFNSLSSSLKKRPLRALACLSSSSNKIPLRRLRPTEHAAIAEEEVVQVVVVPMVVVDVTVERITVKVLRNMRASDSSFLFASLI